MAEREMRSELLNTLLTTLHGDLAELYPVHEQMIHQDPLFYMHMAAWYADHGQVRDHKEMFVVMLCLSDFDGHRDEGLALLRELPPFEMARVVDFIKGTTVKRRKPNPRQFIYGEQKFEIVSQNVGLFRNVPRSMRTEIVRYLREREADPQRFDRTVMVARRSLKRLYAGLHIPPSERAQAILFQDSPPPDSLAFVVKQIAQAGTPDEQARMIVEYRIPYRVASTVIQEMSPMVLAALIEVMTPQDVTNNIVSLRRHGAFNKRDIKALVNAKLAQAESDKRVSANKAKVAVDAAGASGDMAEALESMIKAQIKARGKITRPTALLIDKSSRMKVAIEVGKQLGAMISAICEAELFTYAFDTDAYSVEPKRQANLVERILGRDTVEQGLQPPSLSDWEKALARIKAGGGTSCGIAIERMRRKRQRVEQIVMVTNEGEVFSPRFKDAYLAYTNKLKVRPAVILVKVEGAGNRVVETACAQLGIAPQVFEFSGDYNALPNVIPLLSFPSLSEIVTEVLDHPLPKRKPA